jgi:Tfp pilus assembly protein PilN
MPTRAALESKQRILESQLSAAQAQVEEVQRTEKQTAQQFRSKDVCGMSK